MSTVISYKCKCDGDLLPTENGGKKNLYLCDGCGQAYERRRSDRKWIMRPVKTPTKKSGVIAPRPAAWGLLWLPDM